MRMLPEFDHCKILEQKCLGQPYVNRNRNNGVRDRIKAQQDNCIFDITDFGSKSIKKAASVRLAFQEFCNYQESHNFLILLKLDLETFEAFKAK